MAAERTDTPQPNPEWHRTSPSWEERDLVDTTGVRYGSELKRHRNDDYTGGVFLFEQVIDDVSVDRWHYDTGTHTHIDLVTGEKTTTVRNGNTWLDGNIYHQRDTLLDPAIIRRFPFKIHVELPTKTS